MDDALRLAELWLDQVTDLPATGIIGKAWSRAEWVEETLGTWKRLTEPVANSVANALSAAMTEQMPEEMKSMMGGASSMLQNVGGAIFGMQLGQAIGALSTDVVSSTDIGVPLADLEMALLPGNVAKFGEGLSLPENDIRLFLAVREAAHARLFVQVPWLRGHLLGAIEAYARGIHIDTSRIEELARDLDPSNPEGNTGGPLTGRLHAAAHAGTGPGPAEAGDRAGPRRGLGGRTHGRRPPKRSSPPLQRSAKRYAGAGPPAVPRNMLSLPWWGWNCGPAGCGRPPRCGPH